VEIGCVTAKKLGTRNVAFRMLMLPCIRVGSEIGFMLARRLYSQPEQAIDQRSATSNKVLQGVRIGNAIFGDLQIATGHSICPLSVDHWHGCASPHVAFSRVRTTTGVWTVVKAIVVMLICEYQSSSLPCAALSH
jgi:hypothetical protein